MSNRTRLPLGDYYQLLLRHGLLADAAPLAADLTHPVSLVSCDSKLVIPNTPLPEGGAKRRGVPLLRYGTGGPRFMC